MDGSHRIKIKIGPYEFEAEGSAVVVQSQFDAFKELIASAPPPPAAPTAPMADQRADGSATSAGTIPDQSLGKIMKLDGRIVSFTVPPKSLSDAVLLLLLGQKLLRGNDSVSGAEMVDGMTATGGMNGARSDRLLERAAKDGDVIVIGERRAKRYRLTNTGLAKARQLANELIAVVA